MRERAILGKNGKTEKKEVSKKLLLKMKNPTILTKKKA